MCKTSLRKDSRKLRSFDERQDPTQLLQLLFGEQVQGKRPGHWSSNRFVGDSCSDRSAWKTNYTKALQEGEKLLHITVDTRRESQKARALAPPTNIHLYLWFLSPHLPIKNWTPKPSQKMFKEMYNYELTLKLWTRMSDNANKNKKKFN